MLYTLHAYIYIHVIICVNWLKLPELSCSIDKGLSTGKQPMMTTPNECHVIGRPRTLFIPREPLSSLEPVVVTGQVDMPTLEGRILQKSHSSKILSPSLFFDRDGQRQNDQNVENKGSVQL